MTNEVRVALTHIAFDTTRSRGDETVEQLQSSLKQCRDLAYTALLSDDHTELPEEPLHGKDTVLHT